MATTNSVLVNTDRNIEHCPNKYKMQSSRQDDKWVILEHFYHCRNHQYLKYKNEWEMTDRYCRHCEWLYKHSFKSSSNKFEKMIRS